MGLLRGWGIERCGRIKRKSMENYTTDIAETTKNYSETELPAVNMRNEDTWRNQYWEDGETLQSLEDDWRQISNMNFRLFGLSDERLINSHLTKEQRNELNNRYGSNRSRNKFNASVEMARSNISDKMNGIRNNMAQSHRDNDHRSEAERREDDERQAIWDEENRRTATEHRRQDTTHQRAVDDLRRAGLNPAMLGMVGGGGGGGGGSAGNSNRASDRRRRRHEEEEDKLLQNLMMAMVLGTRRRL